MEVKVPDIGDFKDVPVVEIMVSVGARIEKEDPLVSLESDKATIEVPAPAAGTVRSIELKVGDKVSQGTLVLVPRALFGQAQHLAGAGMEGWGLLAGREGAAAETAGIEQDGA
jgi:pyruvate dehydrogenase E2 component (dihydrolipoamide acetyltransferase)